MLPDPRNPFDHDEAAQAFADILAARASKEEIEAFLIALTARGETMVEIAAAAQAMRDRLIPIDAPEGAIDVCGTGGDGHHTLNVSTAVSIVVAACEVPVAKHGNRAASSKAGAADTLEALGLDMERAGRMAEETLKDPYLFDFLGLGDEAHEREIENGLIRHITRFLLELGAGFAFVGRQFRLEVAGDEFFIDLLFYHTRLKCYVVVELKATAFKPEHAGQLNFYLAALDAQVRAADDKPTIGLLLCKQQNRLVAEYALSGIDKPIGVAEYQLMRDLPANLGASLPSIAQIEAELSGDLPEPP